MTAIHMQAMGLDGELIRVTVEEALRRLTGVVRVAIVCSVGLISVLFDETRVRSEQVLRAVRATGIDARLYGQ